ncbi:MAG: S1 RNA-binding domain-containing protein [Eubacterium sp.]
MIKLGEYQELIIKRFAGQGAYIGIEPGEEILLPGKQVPQDTKINDKINVFVYKDSDDRLIATTERPYIKLGQVASLKVKDVTKIGAFMDWGLAKDLLMPFKQQTVKVKTGDEYLVALYIDKSNRLCATMNIYNYLRTDSPYKAEDEVTATVFEINKNYGVFAAVDNIYLGMIPIREFHQNVDIGEKIHARVTSVRSDGKLDLSMQKKAYLQIDEDAEHVKNVIADMGGVLPYGEKASPKQIELDFGLSKSAFKRALGKLYKERMIELTDSQIRLK